MRKTLLLGIASIATICGINTYAATEMILVKGGTFKMGNEKETVFADELPVHDVTLNDFYIGTYEISQQEWQNVMGYNPSHFQGDDLPVESISWYEAVNFCNKLSEKEGLTPAYKFGRGNTVIWDDKANGYRLPTEAEWEYAARGGADTKNTIYSGSDDADIVGWFKANSKATTHPSGMKACNEIGLYDMSGNVWEWCWDWYGDYSSKPATNPKGPVMGTERCRRGGGWHIIEKSCRNTNRIGTPPTYSFDYVGLRVVRNAK